VCGRVGGRGLASKLARRGRRDGDVVHIVYLVSAACSSCTAARAANSFCGEPLMISGRCRLQLL
jgi:hypothetical protein